MDYFSTSTITQRLFLGSWEHTALRYLKVIYQVMTAPKGQYSLLGAEQQLNQS